MSPLQKSEYNKLLPLHYAPHANELSREGYYASAGTCRYISSFLSAKQTYIS